MSLLTNSLIVLTLIYISSILYIKNSEIQLPDWMRITAGVLILIQTRKGIPQIKKLSNSTTKWNSWGNMGVYFALFVMGGVFLFTLYSLFILLTTSTEPSITNPKNYLVIPGVNDFIPLTVVLEVLIALLFAMVVHELGHAIYCIYEDIGIESTGIVLFGIIPIGAFVEPNEEGQESASRRSRLRMFSAGVFNNLWTTLISLGLLVLIASTLITPIGGAYISNSETPQLERGDVIQSVNGVEVNSNSEFVTTMRESEGESVTLSLSDGTETTIQKKLYISGVLADSTLESGAKITQVNGQAVNSVSELQSLIYDSTSNEVEITTENGTNVVHDTGATYIIRDSVVVDDTTMPRNSLIRITSINDSTIHSSSQIDTLEEGDSITFEFKDSEYTNESVSDEFIESVVAIDGINGLELKQLNASFFEAQLFYNIVSGLGIEAIGVGLWFTILFFAPFGSLVGLDNNFPGFTSDISNFYTVTDPSLSGLEPGLMFVLTILYWSFWLNCNLFIFNCLPTYALDGGHILRDSISLGSEKIGIEPKTAKVVTSIILSTTVVTLLLLLGYSVI